MKIKRIILLLSIINFNTINSQGYEPFKSGEWLKYKISYSGWLKAGEATMSIKSDTMDDKELYHVVALGKTIGPINWFFKVRDRYESYFDKRNILPLKFIRNINEGGYTKDLSIIFDRSTAMADSDEYIIHPLPSLSTRALKIILSKLLGVVRISNVELFTPL